MGRPLIKIGFYGDSHMHHDGYVKQLEIKLARKLSMHDIEVINYAVGGFTSRDVVNVIASHDDKFDISFLGVGTNDVWRKFQERVSESVDCDEYKSNINMILERLIRVSRSVYVIGIPPFNMHREYGHMNKVVMQYNAALEKEAQKYSIHFVDTYSVLRDKHLDFSIWIDDAHLSDIGNLIVAESIYGQLDAQKILE